MTDRYAARVTRADGRFAYEAAPDRLRQPDKPSVTFIGDPGSDEPTPWFAPPPWFSAALLIAGFVVLAMGWVS